MKRIAVLLLACLLLATGCREREEAAEETQPAVNAGGTAAVDADVLDEYLDPDTGLTHGELTERMDGDVIEIKEKLFIAQINDIYYNVYDYMGKTIKYEGIYDRYVDESSGEAFHYVIRYGPGCCGNDGNAGFDVTFDGDWPEQDDWVEAVGQLELYEYNNMTFLRLNLESLTVKEERGEEYVSM